MSGNLASWSDPYSRPTGFYTSLHEGSNVQKLSNHVRVMLRYAEKLVMRYARQDLKPSAKWYGPPQQPKAQEKREIPPPTLPAPKSMGAKGAAGFRAVVRHAVVKAGAVLRPTAPSSWRDPDDERSYGWESGCLPPHQRKLLGLDR